MRALSYWAVSQPLSSFRRHRGYFGSPDERPTMIMLPFSSCGVSVRCAQLQRGYEDD